MGRFTTHREFFTTTITRAEILYGIAILPEGRRKQKLQNAAQATFDQDFLNRVLPFDLEAAVHFASIAADRRKQGNPISQFDAQIAAICRTYGAAISTRNVDDFTNCGLEIINPWEA